MVISINRPESLDMGDMKCFCLSRFVLSLFLDEYLIHVKNYISSKNSPIVINSSNTM